jgi:glycosyltransferase involved in cell wall biosynthesis
LKAEQKNILFITDELNKVCGVSNHLLILIAELNKSSFFNNIFLVSGGGNNINNFEKLNVKMLINPVFLHKNRSILNFAKGINLLRNLVRIEKVGIIHSHNHYAANISYYSSLLLDTVTIQTNHGIIPKGGLLNHHKADYHIVLSDSIKGYYLSNKISRPENIVLIKPGVHCKKLVNKSKNLKPLVLSSSRFVKEKHPETFIKAASKIKSKVPDICSFILSGDGIEKENLIKLNNNWGNSVIFNNSLDKYTELLGKASVFVITSESEGVPTVLMEAIYNDCIVISSKFRGYEEILKNYPDELLFEVGEYNKLSEILLYVLKNVHGIKKQLNNFFDNFKKEYNLESMITGHLDIYEKIFNPPKIYR